MATQFEKRKAKSAVDVAKEIESKRDDIRAQSLEEPVYTSTALDIYTNDGGKTFGVAEISYNPETGVAKVINTFNISRIIALSYANQKMALGTLKKKKDT